MAFTSIVYGTVSDEFITTGVQDVYGVTINNTVGNGGWQYVFSGGTANNSIVNLSGRQIVMSGGTANSTIINDGGTLEVRAGGIVGGTITVDGGAIVVEAGAVVNLTRLCYDLDHAENGDILVSLGSHAANVSNFSLDLDGTDDGTYVLADGIGGGLTGNAFEVNYNGQDINLAVGSSYTFANGRKISLNITESNTRLLAVFETLPGDFTAPTVPTGLTQAVTGNNVTVDWADSTDASGIKGYEVRVDNNNDFSSVEYTNTVTASQDTGNDIPIGTYYWQVRAQDNNGNWSAWSNSASFAISSGVVDDHTPPSTPTGLTVARNGKAINISWDACTDKSGIKQYQIQFNDKNDFTAPKHTEDVDSNRIDSVNDNMPQGTYYWRVRAQDNSNNWGAWSTVSSLKNDLTPPSAPTNLTSKVTGSSVVADWADSTDSMTGIKNYEFQVDKHSDFLTPEGSEFVAKSENSGTDVEVGKYYWRVRAQDNAGNFSTWTKGTPFIVTPADTAGNTWQTATDIAKLDNWVGYGDAADFYKLMMDNAGTLTLNLTGLTGNANLSLLDATGRILKTSANLGITSESIVNYLLLSGTYYVKVAPADGGRGADNTDYILTHAKKYCPADAAANTWQTAKDIANLDNWVGYGDAADFYKLAMDRAGTLTLNLTGLTGNANLSLLDATGRILKTSANLGTTSESIVNYLLLSGTYYVKVAPADGGRGADNTDYILTHAKKYCPADAAANTWQAAKDIANLDNWVGYGDAADFYKLAMDRAGTLTLNLTGLTGNANLSLLDATGRILKTSANLGTTSESIVNYLLLSGTYYVKVAPADGGRGADNTDYILTHAKKYCPADAAANTWQTAKDIATLDNWVGYGDAADFYKLTMDRAGMLTLNLTGLTGDANLSLLDATGRVLKTSANRGNTSEVITDFALLGGTYYINVATADSGRGTVNTDYILTHAEKYCPVDAAANTWQTAKDIANLDNWVGYGDAADFYKLTMANNGILSLNLTGLTGDANLTLLDATGRTLKTSANRLLANEAITTELKAGTYYVNVAPVRGVNNAGYTLAHVEKYCPPDTAGSSFATAREITSGTIHEWLGFGDKEDYYKFVVQNNGSTAGGGLSGFSSNINLFIYNSSGKLVDSSANLGLTPEFAASDAGTVEAGTYYIKVVLAGTAATDYDLNFNLTGPGSLRLFGASSPLTGGSDTVLANDPLKKSQGMLAS